MDAFVDILIQHGYWGMFVAAFLAASVFPFSSEAVMVGLQVAGLSPLPLLLWGTAGNVAGSMFNYCIGRLGRIEWIEKYLHVKKEKMERAQHWMEQKGAWVGGFLTRLITKPDTTPEATEDDIRVIARQGKHSSHRRFQV